MIVEVNQLRAYLDHRWVLDGIDLAIKAGEVVTVIGDSGCGKSTLLRHLMLLRRPDAGGIKLFGQSIDFDQQQQLNQYRRRMGVLFQGGALFSGLTVFENVDFVLREYTDLPPSIRHECVYLKIQMAGLAHTAAQQYPAQLSGGMQKRAALARALALDPPLLLLDEPTAGLDPVASGAFDELILALKESLGLTIILVTHDVDSLKSIASRIVYLSQGKVLAADSYPAVMNTNAQTQAYFSRGRQCSQAKVSHGI